MLLHMWEQQIVKFVNDELEHNIRFSGKKINEYSVAQKILALHGVVIENTQAWVKIRELKALVNVIKHGDGDAADRLRKIRPDFFEAKYIKVDTLELEGSVLLEDNVLQVTESDLHKYISATKSFWDEMPEYVYADITKILAELNK